MDNGRTTRSLARRVECDASYSEFAVIIIFANKHNDSAILNELSIAACPFQVGLTPTYLYLGNISVRGGDRK